MNNHESLQSGPNDNAWDNLKEIKFAGEKYGDQRGQNKPNTTVDSSINTPEDALKSKETLKSIADDYLEQYKPNSKATAANLVKKRALDKFIVKKATGTDSEVFLRSQEFKNYAGYIMNIADSKKLPLNDGEDTVCYPEFFTNPTLKNPKTRTAIFKTAYPNTDLSKMNDWYDRNQKIYKNLVEGLTQKMENQKKMTQRQMDILGDYIYDGDNFEDGVAQKYAEYCFNEIEPGDDIKPSTPMMGALANYFAKEYTIDEEVNKNSRFIIANNLRSASDDAVNVGISTSFGIVLEQNRLLRASLTSDDSLNKSRTFRETNNDLYHFMMVAFHELTHDHQRNMVKKGDKSSSAMMYIMRDILQQGGGCYIGKKTDGTETKATYYKVNHDNDEIEIQADEEAWRQCRSFLASHQKVYEWAHPNGRLRGKFGERRTKCIKNEKEVRARRSFTKKHANTGEDFSAIKYNIETLQSVVKNTPDILRTYPQLNDYIDKTGELKPEIFIKTEIAKLDREGLDRRDDVFGAEIGTYMLGTGKEVNKLIDYIKNNNNNFTERQVETIITNFYNIIHQTVEKNRALKGIDLNNYDETKARGKDFDMIDKKTAILKQYLKQCYNAIWATSIIKKHHPGLEDWINRQETVYLANYYKELAANTNLSNDFAEMVVETYNKTKNPALVGIANQIKNDYKIR